MGGVSDDDELKAPAIVFPGQAAPEAAFRTAYDLLARRAPAEALDVIEPALADEPDNTGLRMLRAWAFLMRAQLQRAEAELEWLVEQNPSDDWAQHALGRGDRAGRHRLDRQQAAGVVAADVEGRVHDGARVVDEAREQHRQRVDEEGHVVAHDLDDRVTGSGPAVLGDGRREDPHLGLAGPALLGEVVVGREGAVHVDVAAGGQLLGRDVPVVGRQHLGQRVTRRPTRPLRRPGRRCGLLEDAVTVGPRCRGRQRRR